MDRWLTGYADVLRSSLTFGRFRIAEDDPAEVEARVAKALGRAKPWAWGGGAAAFRLTGHYRGEDSVLWVLEPTSDLPRALNALPAKDGPLTLLRAKGTLMLEGAKPHTAHPLLVWRSTNDIDISVSIELDELPAGLDRLPGWSPDPRAEHRWLAPENVKVDILPAGPN